MNIKKIKVIICILVLLSLCFYCVPSFAAVKAEPSLSVANVNVKPGDTVTLLIAVTGVSGIEGDEGIQGIQGKINYDTNVFSDLKVEKDGAWSYAQENAGKVIAAATNPLKADSNVMKVTLKVKDSAASGSSTISLQDCIIASSNAETVNANKIATATITVGAGTNNNTNTISNSTNAATNNAASSKVQNITTVNDTANKAIPKAGKFALAPIIVLIIVFAAIALKKFNKLYDIK